MNKEQKQKLVDFCLARYKTIFEDTNPGQVYPSHIPCNWADCNEQVEIVEPFVSIFAHNEFCQISKCAQDHYGLFKLTSEESSAFIEELRRIKDCDNQVNNVHENV